MSKKKKQKKYNPLKTIKSMARNLFMDIPMDTQVHKVKKKYNRKKKYKERFEDE